MQMVILRMDKQQGPIITGNDVQSPEINNNGKEYFQKNVHMYKKTASLCYTEEIGTTL